MTELERLPVVALVGRPNVGKSTFLAHATGRYAESANLPGTTIVAERRRVYDAPDHGDAAKIAHGRHWRRGNRRRDGERGGAWLVDMPGTASLSDRPTGEAPFWTALLSEEPDAIIIVIDAGDVARHLPLVLGCRDLGLPVVVAANFADEAAERGVVLDAGRLSQLLVAPVHLTVGRDGSGVDAAVGDAVRLARQRRAFRTGASSPRGTAPASLYPLTLEARLQSEARSLSVEAAGSSLGAAALDADGLAGLAGSGVVSFRGAASLRLAAALEPARWDAARRLAAQVESMRTMAPTARSVGRLGSAGALASAGVLGSTVGLGSIGAFGAIGSAERFGSVASIGSADALGSVASAGSRRMDRLARLSTAPWPGLPLFAGATIASLLITMVIGGWLSGILGAAWGATVSPALATILPSLLPAPVAATLQWGLDAGLLGLLTVGIPYVLTFYILLAFLEDSGYLTSAAVLTDRLFNALGLPGRAAIPLLAAAGCNVPAIYGTRVLATRRERVLAAFLITMTPCSARSAVVVAALAPFAGPGVALAAFGVIALITIGGGLAANKLVPGRQPALVLELAPLRRPVLRLVVRKAWVRFVWFVRSAAPVMLVSSLVLGGMYESGLIWPIANVIRPVITGWLGLPAVAGVALVFSFLRKELALQLLVALAVVQLGASAANLGTFMTAAQLFVYAVVTSVSVPCVATVAALTSEFGRRTALVMSGATIGIALAAGGVLARILGIA